MSKMSERLKLAAASSEKRERKRLGDAEFERRAVERKEQILKMNSDPNSLSAAKEFLGAFNRALKGKP